MGVGARGDKIGREGSQERPIYDCVESVRPSDRARSETRGRVRRERCGFSQKYGLRVDDGVETGGVFGRSEEGF